MRRPLLAALAALATGPAAAACVYSPVIVIDAGSSPFVIADPVLRFDQLTVQFVGGTMVLTQPATIGFDCGLFSDGDGGTIFYKGQTTIDLGFGTPVRAPLSFVPSAPGSSLTIHNNSTLRIEDGQLLNLPAAPYPMTHFVNGAGASVTVKGAAPVSSGGSGLLASVIDWSNASFDNLGSVTVAAPTTGSPGTFASNVLVLGGGLQDGGSFRVSGGDTSNVPAIAFGGQQVFQGHVLMGTDGAGGFDAHGQIQVIAGAQVRMAAGAKVDIGAGLFQIAQGASWDYSGGELSMHGSPAPYDDKYRLNLGTLFARGSGRLTLDDELDNLGTFEDALPGPGQAGSVVTTINGAFVNNTGASATMHNMVLNGWVQNAGRFTVDGGTSVVLEGCSFRCGYFLNFGQLAIHRWQMDGTLINSSGTLTVGDAGTGPGTLTGRGTISNFGSPSSFIITAGSSVQAASFSSEGGSVTIDGRLDTFGGDVVISGGVLDGIGSVNLGVPGGDPASLGSLVFTGAYFRPGHSPGRFTIVGKLSMGAGSELELQVERLPDGTLAWDHVSATRISFLAGSKVHFVVGDGVAGSAVQTLSFLDCGQGCSFDAATAFVVDGAPGAQFAAGPGGLSLSIPAVVPVPEPGTLGLICVGIAAGALRANRRRSL